MVRDDNNNFIFNTRRTFQLYDEENDKVLGRYYGKFPKRAAYKAFTQLVNKRKGDGLYNDGDLIIFKIKECTRNSKKKIYKYEGRRIRLDNPQFIRINQRGGDHRDINFLYRNNVRKAI